MWSNTTDSAPKLLMIKYLQFLRDALMICFITCTGALLLLLPFLLVHLNQRNSEHRQQTHCKFRVEKEKCFMRLLAAGSLLRSIRSYNPPSCGGIHNCRQRRWCSVSVQATHHLQSDDQGCRCEAGFMGSVFSCSLVFAGLISIVVSTMSFAVFGAISFSMERDNLWKQITFWKGRTDTSNLDLLLPLAFLSRIRN